LDPAARDRDSLDREYADRADYQVVLCCPACGERSSQRVMKSNLLLPVQVPGHPFLRAYTWSDGKARTARPLHFGICLCPCCHYPGVEADFRDGTERTHDISRTLRKFFVDQSVGWGPPLTDLLGTGLDTMEDPERTTRLHLAAIATQRQIYPELWRRREIGQLYLRLAWLYLDELHLRWDPNHSTQPPTYEAEGPGYARMQAVFSRLEPVREVWPEIPLDEESTRCEVLLFHEDAYTRRAGVLTPEESVADERLLAVLFGLNGQLDMAKEMYERALDTCIRLRQEATQQQLGAWSAGLNATETKTLAIRVQRLGKRAEGIRDEMNTAFPPPKAKGTPGSGRGASGPPQKKRRLFGIFG
jgi:hypothetical protein